jgi:HEAT repeat protein
MRRLAARVFLAAALLAPTARALAWPDVSARIERDLGDNDPTVRLLATERLDSLGPRRASPLVLRALADADPGVRIAAAEAAVRARVAGSTAIVIPWLSEADARLRGAACSVARALPDPRAVAPLARALSDIDGAVRMGAIVALGAQGSTAAVAPLLGKLDDSTPAIRIEVARALARLGDRRAVVPLIGKVEDPAADVRQAVAHALGDLGDVRAVPALVLQLRDGSTDVRVAALLAVARVRGADAVDAVASLVTDRVPEVRHAAIATLGTWARGGSADALRQLLARLGVDEDASGDLGPTPARDALRKAGQVAVQPLCGILRGGAPPAVATSAAWILGALGATTAAPDIIAALRRGTLPAAAALHAIIGTGSADDLPVVLEFVGDENPTVRHQAFAATRALLDPARPDGRAVEPLVAIARSSWLTLAEEREVIELLGRTGARRASEVLEELLQKHDVATKVAALDALGALGPTSVDDSLLGLIGDRVPDVRLHAAEALASAGGATARDALLQRLSSGAELDRAAALTALGGILARAPLDRAWSQLGQALEFAAGGERDAILLVLGRAAPVQPVVERLSYLDDPDDRRTLAASCAGRAEGIPLLRRLLADSDPSVRAEAAWSLGSVAEPALVPELARLAAASGAETPEVAVDATGAIGRIAGRTRDPQATTALCGLIRDRRAPVRANAAAGLALAGARCGDGSVERALLLDPSDSVRAAAARVLVRTPLSDDERDALARCAASDRSGEVAWVCQHVVQRPSGPPRATVAYVESLSAADPRPRAPYFVALGDGLLRAGTTDRRGAFCDPVAPDGPMRLHPTDELSP